MRPRPVIENRTYMFTRRCSERRYFLRPDAETTNAFWYCLGWAAQKHRQVLHAAVALSNHAHVVATDPHGVYPDFLRDFHGLLARVLNAWRGRWEHFWDANQASAVALEDEAAQFDKIVYVLANPVGLVEKASDWPGATAIHSIADARPVVAVRPKHFFRDDDLGGEMPKTVTITFEPPPALTHLSRQEYVDLLREKLAFLEKDAAATRRDTGAPSSGANGSFRNTGTTGRPMPSRADSSAPLSRAATSGAASSASNATSSFKRFTGLPSRGSAQALRPSFPSAHGACAFGPPSRSAPPEPAGVPRTNDILSSS